ncbi:MAG: hypothetical protein ACOH15_04915 [Acetobacterium sp.]
MPPRKDLTGLRFGHLVVLKQADKIGNDTHRAWLCHCDCGNEIILRGFLLTGGKNTHCGCLNKIKVNILGKKYGRLTVIGFAKNDNYQNAQWLCRCDCGTEKIINGANLRRGAIQSCGCLKLEQNAADMQGRRTNDLVEGTALGKISSSTLNSNNVSGCKGVSWNTKTSKWFANITFQKKRIFLGSFALPENAIAARKEAEETYYVPILEKYNYKSKHL